MGGNNVTAELRDPGAANSPLMVSAIGSDVLVTLATDADGDLSSTAQQVIDAIAANPAANALVKGITYRGAVGSGIAQPRTKVNLSDFLQPVTPMGRTDISLSNDHVQRGPFQQNVLRIRRVQGGPTGPKVGVFLYCQQHAREWATPHHVPRDRRAAAPQLRDSTRGRGSSSTTSTSSSSRRRTRTAGTTRCTTSASSAGT